MHTHTHTCVARRYGAAGGAEGRALLAALVAARRRQLLEQSLSRSMSALAWEAAIAKYRPAAQ
jgi:hypothetical protein